jgi:hypothetical protein
MKPFPRRMWLSPFCLFPLLAGGHIASVAGGIAGIKGAPFSAEAVLESARVFSYGGTEHREWHVRISMLITTSHMSLSSYQLGK